MNWNTVDKLPEDYTDVIFTDGYDWWKGFIGDRYDYQLDKRIYPQWITSEGEYISDVTHWIEVELLNA